MGPWTHGDAPLDRTWSGDADFGPTAPTSGNLAESVPHLRLQFFDHVLKGLRSGWDDVAPARIFVMGGGSGRRIASGRMDHGGEWRDEQEWPPARAETRSWYLHADGSLQPAKAAAGSAASQYDFDPRRPVPSISANVSSLREYAPPDPGLKDGIWPPTMRSRELIQPGGADQREHPDVMGAEPPYLATAARSDVLSFRTARSTPIWKSPAPSPSRSGSRPMRATPMSPRCCSTATHPAPTIPRATLCASATASSASASASAQSARSWSAPARSSKSPSSSIPPAICSPQDTASASRSAAPTTPASTSIPTPANRSASTPTPKSQEPKSGTTPATPAALTYPSSASPSSPVLRHSALPPSFLRRQESRRPPNTHARLCPLNGPPSHPRAPIGDPAPSNSRALSKPPSSPGFLPAQSRPLA